ncbi:hypothetical protein BA6E_11214 [Bacteroidales bacterium 6E]|nr:hypothetical protein BA6E_11214 [Bacteroidales bacterium 6E]
MWFEQILKHSKQIEKRFIRIMNSIVQTKCLKKSTYETNKTIRGGFAYSILFFM